MKIPFFNYPDLYQSNKSDYDEIFSSIANKGAYILQNELSEFEVKLADYTGAKYAIGVANATDALQMAIMAWGDAQGKEFIFCSHTMVATASAIHFAGGIPVPIDAGEDHLIDCSKIRAAITDKTVAIVPTQLNGRVSNMDEINSIADEYNLVIFEDSAQALGAKYDGVMAGNFGIAGCISFYPAKILGCFGDGGAVLTNHKDIYEKLMLLRDHGRSEVTGDVELWGFNSRLDNLQAAILLRNFKDFDHIIDRRRSIANLYEDNLSIVHSIKLPPKPNSDTKYFDVYQNYEIEAENRDALKLYLSDGGIGTLVQWGGKAVHQFEKLNFNTSLPYTESLFKRMLMLPMNMTLTDEEVVYICNQIKEFYS